MIDHLDRADKRRFSTGRVPPQRWRRAHRLSGVLDVRRV